MNFKSPKFKSKIKKVFYIVAGWMAATLYINLMIMSQKESVKTQNIPILLLTILAEVFIAGLIFASFEVFYFADRFRKKSFAYAVLMKTLYYALSLTLFTLIFSYIESFVFEKPFNLFLGKISLELLETFYVWGVIFLITEFILEVSDKYGTGVLRDFVLGKYHSPKEETRIFMFLDIKSSTTIAEVLGHVKYFQLINDFFYDVTDSIIESKGEIYQYVGDELVVSWKMNNGIEDANCLNCFFSAYSAIKKSSHKYEKKFGIVPSFKAGMHYGKVTVGEVGVLKKEIAFSGDVLNTASRIQEICNKYNEKLVVSKRPS